MPGVDVSTAGQGSPRLPGWGTGGQQGLQSFSPDGGEMFVLLLQWRGEVVGSQVRVSSAAYTHPAVKQLMIGCLSILSQCPGSILLSSRF